MSSNKIKLINIYVVRNREQGWAELAFTSLELAKKYFLEKRVIPHLDTNPDQVEDFEFDAYNPKSDDEWQSIFDCYDDWEIEKTQLQLQDS